MEECVYDRRQSDLSNVFCRGHFRGSSCEISEGFDKHLDFYTLEHVMIPSDQYTWIFTQTLIEDWSALRLRLEGRLIYLGSITEKVR